MTQKIQDIQRQIVPLLREAGVTRCAVFGSVARNEAKNTSDVDLLVELPSGKSLFDFVDLKLKLEDALQRSVDLVEYDTIKPSLRSAVFRDQIAIL